MMTFASAVVRERDSLPDHKEHHVQKLQIRKSCRVQRSPKAVASGSNPSQLGHQGGTLRGAQIRGGGSLAPFRAHDRIPKTLVVEHAAIGRRKNISMKVKNGLGCIEEIINVLRHCGKEMLKPVAPKRDWTLAANLGD